MTVPGGSLGSKVMVTVSMVSGAAEAEPRSSSADPGSGFFLLLEDLDELRPIVHATMNLIPIFLPILHGLPVRLWPGSHRVISGVELGSNLVSGSLNSLPWTLLAMTTHLGLHRNVPPLVRLHPFLLLLLLVLALPP